MTHVFDAEGEVLAGERPSRPAERRRVAGIGCRHGLHAQPAAGPVQCDQRMRGLVRIKLLRRSRRPRPFHRCCTAATFIGLVRRTSPGVGKPVLSQPEGGTNEIRPDTRRRVPHRRGRRPAPQQTDTPGPPGGLCPHGLTRATKVKRQPESGRNPNQPRTRSSRPCHDNPPSTSTSPGVAALTWEL
jgi:hypothetical protein